MSNKKKIELPKKQAPVLKRATGAPALRQAHRNEQPVQTMEEVEEGFQKGMEAIHETFEKGLLGETKRYNDNINARHFLVISFQNEANKVAWLRATGWWRFSNYYLCGEQLAKAIRERDPSFDLDLPIPPRPNWDRKKKMQALVDTDAMKNPDDLDLDDLHDDDDDDDLHGMDDDFE